MIFRSLLQQRVSTSFRNVLLWRLMDAAGTLIIRNTWKTCAAFPVEVKIAKMKVEYVQFGPAWVHVIRTDMCKIIAKRVVICVVFKLETVLLQ